MSEGSLQCEGQLDVFDVLALIEEEGLVEPNGRHTQPDDLPPEPDPTMSYAKFFGEDEPDDGLHVERGANSTYWVISREGLRQHPAPFHSQIECWAFIRGVRITRDRF